MVTIASAQFNELDIWILYGILRLRTDVFVVEQECPYPELDGRDGEADTRHVWAVDSDRIVAYLRITAEPDGSRIGRVCTAAAARGRGLAARLMAVALEHVGAGPVWLHAQTAVVPFYERHGFGVAGPTFLEDGIPHVLMTRTPDQAVPAAAPRSAVPRR